MKRAKQNKGFTLLELLVSIAIFLVVGGVALELASKAMPLYTKQQNSTSLNIGLRSAVAQIEQDVVNAGTGYYVGGTYPDWPVGVTIFKGPAGTCYDATAKTYGANCFDTLNVITTDLNTPPGLLGGAGPNVYSSSTTLTVAVPASINPATGAAWTASDYAAKYVSGDQVLLLTGGTSNNKYTTFKLNAATTATAGPPATITLTHATTNADAIAPALPAAPAGGSNGANAGILSPPAAAATACTATAAPTNDYLGITMCASDKLTGTFQPGNAWLLKLATVSYCVDASDITNPKLRRRVGSGACSAGDVVSEQIIGFRVGASIWNNGNGTDQYIFEPSQFPDMTSPWGGGYDPYNYTRVRSIRVSLIGRTTPSTDPTYSFRNTFDGGKYQIQAASVVVNPRNLSMRDQ